MNFIRYFLYTCRVMGFFPYSLSKDRTPTKCGERMINTTDETSQLHFVPNRWFYRYSLWMVIIYIVSYVTILLDGISHLTRMAHLTMFWKLATIITSIQSFQRLIVVILIWRSHNDIKKIMSEILYVPLRPSHSIYVVVLLNVIWFLGSILLHFDNPLNYGAFKQVVVFIITVLENYVEMYVLMLFWCISKSIYIIIQKCSQIFQKSYLLQEDGQKYKLMFCILKANHLQNGLNRYLYIPVTMLIFSIMLYVTVSLFVVLQVPSLVPLVHGILSVRYATMLIIMCSAAGQASEEVRRLARYYHSLNRSAYVQSSSNVVTTSMACPTKRGRLPNGHVKLRFYNNNTQLTVYA